MKNKLPECPKCEEDELWVNTGKNVLTVKCYLCGWSADIALPLAIGEIEKKIAAAVAAAKAGGTA